jgi:hypothetical protein
VSSATASNGTLRARGAAMELLLPLTTEFFGLRVTELRLDGRVALGDNGRGPSLTPLAADVHGARLGALVPISEIYRAVNAFATDACACLDIGGQSLVVQSAGGWQCNRAGTSACDSGDPDESICIDLATYCSAALLLVSPDVADSISIGLWVHGVSATLQGFVGADGAGLECP